MKEYLIVDGYNIIGAWPELAKLRDEEDMAYARDSIFLIESLLFSKQKSLAKARLFIIH